MIGAVEAAVIGGGPAGLMAAERLAAAGVRVDVYDAMPSVGRKFLLAGIGGMNITHSEPYDDFVRRYGDRAAELKPLLDGFDPQSLREWIHALGIETFVGSSGRVFPKEMKAAPLLRAWLHRLRASGIAIHTRNRWLGWDDAGALRFASSAGERRVNARAVVLALGGGSWPRLGSDGAWVSELRHYGVEIAPLQPANCGFDVAWSDTMRTRFAGAPVKQVQASIGTQSRRGEFIVTASGVEGSLIYASSAPLRDALLQDQQATLILDLLPDRSETDLAHVLSKPRGARSWSEHLRRQAGLKGVKAALLREAAHEALPTDPVALARLIKSMPLQVLRPRPLDEAISTAGGVRFDALDANLMLQQKPGVFCAGEMLDWEAPTGGYLLTACFATGRAAGDGAARWLREQTEMRVRTR